MHHTRSTIGIATLLIIFLKISDVLCRIVENEKEFFGDEGCEIHICFGFL